MTRVILGGTFAYMHKGHEALIRKAFSVGDFVYIGLTSDRYVRRNKGVLPNRYSQRKRMLASFAKKFEKRFAIHVLEDKYGPTLTGKFDVIVVSKETYKIAKEINVIRAKNGLSRIRIIKIPNVRAYDGRLISSERIFSKEIDRRGRRFGRS